MSVEQGYQSAPHTNKGVVNPAGGPAEPSKPVPCPMCVKGTWTDSNGIKRRCYLCHGTGQVKA
jgi:hypothetical protein